MKPALTRRAWVSTVLLTLILGATLCGLIAWKLSIRASMIPPGHPLTNQIRTTDLKAHTSVIALTLSIAGGVSSLAYFLFGRSQRAATVGSAVVLLLANGLFVFQLAAYYAGYYPSNSNAPPPNAQTQDNTTGEPPNRSLPPTPRPPTVANRPAPPQPTAPANPGTTPTIPAARPVPAAPAPPSASELEVERKATAALAQVRDEVKAKTTEFLAAARPLVDSLAKPPRALRSELDARAKTTAEMKIKAKELEDYFRGLDTRADEALKGAGLEMGDSLRQRMAFTRSVDTFGKGVACGAYERLFDAGQLEAEGLSESAGKWRYDADGQVTSTDTSLKLRLRHLREGVNIQLHRATEAESALKAGTTETPP